MKIHRTNLGDFHTAMRSFLILCLYIMLIVYTLLSVEKYFLEETTITISTVDQIELPSVTFCFIREFYKDKNMSIMSFDDYMKKSKNPVDFFRFAAAEISNKYNYVEFKGDGRYVSLG